jgi:hypothetical protein
LVDSQKIDHPPIKGQWLIFGPKIRSMVEKLTIHQSRVDGQFLDPKLTIWMALPHPYQWLVVEIATQNLVDGQKINHPDCPATPLISGQRSKFPPKIRSMVKK